MASYEVVGKDVVLSASRSDKDDTDPSEDTERLEVGETYDESEIPDSALESFADRFEEVTVVQQTTTDAPFETGELTNDELEARLEDGSYTRSELEALLEHEENNENRSGAIDAIEAQLE